MNDRPTPPLGVTVVVPVYKGAEYLRETLDSIDGQTRTPNELIVVDDCSPDHSMQVLRDWANERTLNYRVSELSTQKNSGSPAEPLNLGISSAKHPLVAILEQDDVFQPNKLERCLAAFDRYPEIEFVTHGASRIDKNGGAASIAQRNFEREPQVRRIASGDAFRMDSDLACRMAVTHSMYPSGFPGLTFRKSAWQQSGRLAQHYRIATDFAFLLALSTSGHSCYLPERLYRRRSHGTNLSHQSSLGFLEVLQCLEDALDARPQLLSVTSMREGVIWRTIEAAWNIAAFGYRTQANQIIARAIATGGWSMKRELQKAAVWLLPAYRYLMMPNAISDEATANAVVLAADHLLCLCAQDSKLVRT